MSTATQETLAIDVRDLDIAYMSGKRRVDVLSGINVKLANGEVLGLVGESGSGKSTMAGVLLASLRTSSFVNSGTVHLAGVDVFKLRGKDLREFRASHVALVPQNAGAALTPTMRIGEQLAEGFRLDAASSASRESKRARAIELLDLVRLPNAAAALDKYPHQFSGGQQQRIGIAMALAARPKLLVLDEPTTGLDVVTQAAILDTLNRLHEELGMAMVLVSHDLGVIDKMCSQVAVLRRGKVVEFGSTRSVLKNPTHPYTKGLLASVPRVTVPGIPPSLDDAAIDAFDNGGDMPVVDTELFQRVAPQGTAPVLSIRGLSVDYNRKPKPGSAPTVLDVDLDVHAGEIVALVGESGSGKSTIANVVAGLQKRQTGELTLDGTTELAPTVAHRAKGVRRAIQIIFQNADTSLNPRRSVRDAVTRPLRLFNVKGLSAEEALAEVGLPGNFGQRLPGQLSGGQRQRVGIARAVSAGPTLVLADEIVSALDVSVQSSILRLMDRLSRENNIGFLFITHDLAVVRSVADRVVVLYLGRIVEEGSVAEIFGNVSHPYTKLLMNSVIEVGDDHAAAPAPGQDEVPAGPPAQGCPFASRCPLVMDICRTTRPPAVELSGTHSIRCHAPLEELSHA
ncbi:ABC transporter ATP-binding protein [Arthrobacter sp. ERGS1:01]|uniref:ABC transporter ATP-binding protein n=1 Tax=Arthrobacter sp. ERGS1:01 TaxID=1704044 RepID=UPI0006B56AB6|nr:ABC transporter ATP-binding protein [Arthrobacter sp. ERGS1:01]